MVDTRTLATSTSFGGTADGWATSRGNMPWALYNQKGLRRFRAFLDGAHAVPANIVAVGDSRVESIGVDNVNTVIDNVLCDRLGFPGRLRTLFARDFGVQEAGMLYPRYNGTDTRVSTSGGTADASTGPMQLAWRIQTGNTITHNLPSCTAFEILCYNDANITGTFSYTVDGGGSTAITATQADSSGNTSGYKRFAVTGLSQATHTLVITGTAASNAIIMGVRYHSGTGVIVSRQGRGGYTTLDALGFGAAFPGNPNAVGNAAAQARMAAFYGAWGPALWILHFDYNDWQAQISASYSSGLKPTPAQYSANLQTMITNITASGGCTLLLGGGNSPAATTPVGGEDLTAYWNALKALTQANADTCAAMILSEYWGSAADGVALGLNASSTSIHPSVRGYGSIGRGIYSALSDRTIPGI